MLLEPPLPGRFRPTCGVIVVGLHRRPDHCPDLRRQRPRRSSSPAYLLSVDDYGDDYDGRVGPPTTCLSPGASNPFKVPVFSVQCSVGPLNGRDTGHSDGLQQ
jgi:hypothetical protein